MEICTCQKIWTVIIASVLFVSFASDQKTSVSEAELRGFFKSIERQGTNIVFTTRSGGMRFVYAIDAKNDMDWKRSEYNETITLPEGSELKMFEHHLFMTISPCLDTNKTKSVSISLEKDFRSFGANITTNYAYLITADEKSDSSDERKGSSDTKLVRRIWQGKTRHCLDRK